MSFILKLQSSDDVVDFMAPAYLLEDAGLIIEAPETQDVWGGESVFADGEQLIQTAFKNRKATIRFEVSGATRDELIGNVAVIDRIIEAAKARSVDEKGSRVEFLYKWDSATSTTYFEVVTGSLEWPDDVMSVEQVHQTNNAGDFCITGFTLTLTLYPYAYPVSPVSGDPIQIDLTNDTGTGQELVVDNSNDADHCNFVEVDASSLPGAYPLVTKLDIKGDSGEAEKIGTVYVGVRSGDFSFRHILEDADASELLGGVTPTADVDYSSGNTHSVITYTVDDPGTSPPIEPVTLAKWNLSAAEADTSMGVFRMFGKVRDTTFWDADCNYAIAIGYGDTVLHQTEWRAPLDTTISLFDFGTVFLPPWGGGVTGLAGMFIKLIALRKTYGTTVVDLDFVALLPQDGGYRVLRYRGEGLGQLEVAVDDGWVRNTYHVTAGGSKVGLVYGLMDRLVLKPNKAHRLYFLMQGLNGSSEVSRKLRFQSGWFRRTWFYLNAANCYSLVIT